jgi:hypothetical protein
VPFSNISRQRKALAIAFTMALSMSRHTGAAVTSDPSGARTTLRPPRLRIEIGTRTVTVRPTAVGLGSLNMPLCWLPV